MTHSNRRVYVGRHLRHERPGGRVRGGPAQAGRAGRGVGGRLHVRRRQRGPGAGARGRGLPSRRRRGRFHRRPRHAAIAAMAPGLRTLRRGQCRHRRPAGPGRLGRHRPDHPRHARAAHRHAQADGLDHGLGQRRALCRAVRYRHDVFRDRRGRPEPHFAPGAGQRRRHDRRGFAGRRPAPWRTTACPPWGSPCSASPRPACSRSRRCWSRATTAWCSTPRARAGSRWRNRWTAICWPACWT